MKINYNLLNIRLSFEDILRLYPELGQNESFIRHKKEIEGLIKDLKTFLFNLQNIESPEEGGHIIGQITLINYLLGLTPL